MHRSRLNTRVILLALFVFPFNWFGMGKPATENTNPIEKTLLSNLPQVSLLPNSPLYQIKKSWEEVRLFLAKDDRQKAEILININQVRLAEALELLKKQKIDYIEKTLLESQEITSEINSINTNLAERDQPGPFNNYLENQEEKISLFNILMREYIIGEHTIEWQR